MVGPLLTLGFGVRALSVEAGWPRALSDGRAGAAWPKMDQTSAEIRR
jgi:hypothetical protein